MSLEVHVRFCEGPKVKLLRPTHPYIRIDRGFLGAVIDWASRSVSQRHGRFILPGGSEGSAARYGKPDIIQHRPNGISYWAGRHSAQGPSSAAAQITHDVLD